MVTETHISLPDIDGVPNGYMMVDWRSGDLMCLQIALQFLSHLLIFRHELFSFSEACSCCTRFGVLVKARQLGLVGSLSEQSIFSGIYLFLYQYPIRD